MGLMSRVFTDGRRDLGLIPGRVIGNTQKWYLIPTFLTHAKSCRNLKNWLRFAKSNNTRERKVRQLKTLTDDIQVRIYLEGWSWLKSNDFEIKCVFLIFFFIFTWCDYLLLSVVRSRNHIRNENPGRLEIEHIPTAQEKMSVVKV